jgi:hypothetical protein
MIDSSDFETALDIIRGLTDMLEQVKQLDSIQENPEARDRVARLIKQADRFLEEHS